MTKGERIRKLREENQMTQEELAKLLRTTKQTISKYENGIVTNIPSDKIEKMAEIFDTNPDSILHWEKTKKNNDTQTDIVVRLRNDDYFLSVVEGINSLNQEQLASIKQMVDVLLKK